MLDFTKCRVLVLGDAMLDVYIDADVSRISPEAAVPIALLGEERHIPGGAANVAANLAALGASVTLASALGDDPAKDSLQRLLTARSVKLASWTAPAGGRPTTVKTRIVAHKAGVAHGRQVIRLDKETNALLAPAEADALWQVAVGQVAETSCCVLSDYGKGVVRSVCSDGVPLGQKLIAECRRRGIPVLVDPKTADWSVYRCASCITPNEAELALASKMPDTGFSALCAGAERIMEELGVEQILLTRSEKGCAFFKRGEASEPVLMESQARKVVDVCGAGDAVAACLVACMGTGMNWKDAACMANIAGGLAVEKPGTATVNAKELADAFLNAESMDDEFGMHP